MFYECGVVHLCFHRGLSSESLTRLQVSSYRSCGGVLTLPTSTGEQNNAVLFLKWTNFKEDMKHQTLVLYSLDVSLWDISPLASDLRSNDLMPIFDWPVNTFIRNRWNHLL